jgi:hypothetical protein
MKKHLPLFLGCLASGVFTVPISAAERWSPLA